MFWICFSYANDYSVSLYPSPNDLHTKEWPTQGWMQNAEFQTLIFFCMGKKEFSAP